MTTERRAEWNNYRKDEVYTGEYCCEKAQHWHVRIFGGCSVAKTSPARAFDHCKRFMVGYGVTGLDNQHVACISSRRGIH